VTDLKAELLAIREAHGRLTPDVVLDEARDPTHVLHTRFCWDDGEAAERYRLGQARNLIRSVKVTYQRPTGEKASVRQFVSIDRSDAAGPATGYLPTEEVLADPLTRRILLRQMEREVGSLMARFEHMQEFRDLLVQRLGLKNSA
jgi:hypothetical protein